MAVSNEKYDQFKVERLRHYLQDMADKGQPLYYEIFVDTLKAVPRTNDNKEFDNYERYMTEDTEKIRIVIYNSAQSNRNDQYCFYVHNKPKQENGLGDLDGIIQEKLAARDREHETNRLKEELEDTKNKLKEAEEYHQLLQEQLEQERNNQQTKKLKIGEMVSLALEGVVRRNPQWVSKVPVVGETLAGIIAQDNENIQQQLNSAPVPETSASFTKKTDSSQPPKPEHLRYIPLLEHLETVFNENQLATVWQVLEKFAENPDNLQPVAELLNIQNP
ncbi:MAG: hypothetical protein ABI675_15115 [Chitinophagaceae bacterium]